MYATFFFAVHVLPFQIEYAYVDCVRREMRRTARLRSARASLFMRSGPSVATAGRCRRRRRPLISGSRSQAVCK